MRCRDEGPDRSGARASEDCATTRAFGAFVDALDGHGFDSLWLSERVAGDSPDPVVGLAFAAGRTEKLKLGTSVQVLPGRNPALLAKEWATLDRMSGGRALPAFGLGNPIAAEHQAFGVAREDRAPIFDEALPLIRRLWSEDDVDHDGEHFTYKQLTVRPKPTQQHLDVWLGGRAKSELRRCGRLGDGWLASFLTAAECAERRPVIEEAAADAERAVDPEHYGAMVLHSRSAVPDFVMERLAALRPGVRSRRPRGRRSGQAAHAARRVHRRRLLEARHRAARRAGRRRRRQLGRRARHHRRRRPRSPDLNLEP